jgi:predicted Zn-dependent protease with MMP-like domain
MTRERFEAIVAEALEEIPEMFRRRLENVEIVVEDEPAPDLLREMGMHPRRDTLFGLYRGVPLRERGMNHAMALPDRITIFYRPLVRACASPGALRREIRKTLVHEIGHFLGMSEAEIRREGY